MEQLLLSTADDTTVRKLDIAPLSGKKVFVEDKYFESYDKGYAVSSIREYLSCGGCRLMNTRDEADTIVEIRSGAVGTDSRSSLFGLPAMKLPVPLSGTAETPELAVYKSERWRSIAKLALFAYDKASGENIYATDPVSSTAHFYKFKIIGVQWRHTDIPELNPNQIKYQFKDDLN